MLEFKVFEARDVIRNVIDGDDTAIINHITTRTVSPSTITEFEFEDFVKEYSEFNRDFDAWIFSHPVLGEVAYDIDPEIVMIDDDYENMPEYNEFLAEVADHLWNWGVEILYVDPIDEIQKEWLNGSVSDEQEITNMDEVSAAIPDWDIVISEPSNSFLSELTDLINRYSKENDSNTPDFIIAQYIENSLIAFNTATQQRETWYGRDATPSFLKGE